MITVTNIGPKQARIFDLKFKKQPSAFVRVHHPSCGHCLEMEPELKKLHKLLQSDYKGNVGIFDIHAEAAPHITTTSVLKSIDGYPTIMAINDDKSSLYHGNRNSDDMLNFCLQNLNLEKILKVYEGGKKSRKLRCPRKHECACPSVRCLLEFEHPGCDKITKCDRKWRRKYKKGGKTRKSKSRKSRKTKVARKRKVNRK